MRKISVFLIVFALSYCLYTIKLNASEARSFEPSARTCAARIDSEGNARPYTATGDKENLQCMVAGFKKTAEFSPEFLTPAIENQLQDKGFKAIDYINKSGEPRNILYQPEQIQLAIAYCNARSINQIGSHPGGFYLDKLFSGYTPDDLMGFYKHLLKVHFISRSWEEVYFNDQELTETLIADAKKLPFFCKPYQLMKTSKGVFQKRASFKLSTDNCRAVISETGEPRENAASTIDEQIDCMRAGFKKSAQFDSNDLLNPLFMNRLPELKKNGFIATIHNDLDFLIIHKPEFRGLVHAECIRKQPNINYYLAGLLEDYTISDIAGYYKRSQPPEQFEKDKKETEELLAAAPAELPWPSCVSYELPDTREEII